MEILIILFFGMAILGVTVIMISEGEDFSYKIIGILAMFSAGGILGVIGTKSTIENRIMQETYKVRELEMTPVFTIKDSTNLLQPNDSVWVNLSTRRVDPADSTAMKCVVLERIKND